MNVVKIHQYDLVDIPGKSVIILEEDVGWLHFGGKLAEFYGRDNIFHSITEIEMVLGHKLEFVRTKELNEDKTGDSDPQGSQDAER